MKPIGIGTGFSIDEDPLPPSESLPGNLLRRAARTTARVGETVLGMPGDIAQTGLNVLKAGERGSDWLANKLGVGGLVGAGESVLPERTPLPTSEDVKTHVTENIGKILPKGYLEAKTPGEKFSDEFFSDLTSLATPIPKLGRMPFRRALAVAGLGNLANWTAKDLGASEGTQTGVKIGTMLATTMAGRGRLNETKRNLYKQADSLVKESDMVSNKLAPVYSKWLSVLDKGDIEAPSKEFIKDRLKAIQRNSMGGKVKMSNVLELKRNWNEIKYAKGLPNAAKPAFEDMMGAIHDMVDEYGKRNPAFIKVWRPAEDIHKGLSQASRVNKFLQRHITEARIGLATTGLLLGHEFGLGHMGTSAKALGVAVGAKYAVKGIEALKNSPEIRKYYARVMTDAAKKDAVSMNRNILKLNNAVEKYQAPDEIAPTSGFSIDQ
jgi:hypothetical protein